MGPQRQPAITKVMRRTRITESCWLWEGGLTGKGYGRVRDGCTHSVLAHRVSYEHFRGAIPEGLQIDHLCRVRNCVNPDHLEPVTPRENLLRSPSTRASLNLKKTHCANGHAFTPENTRLTAGGRVCRACGREYAARVRAHQKAARAAA